MKHNELQKKVIANMNRGGNGFNIVSSNHRGRPDVVGHIGVVFLAVEVKVGKDKLSTTQRATLLRIVETGGLGIVVHEKHYKVFTAYTAKIKQDIANNAPIDTIGKPIPKELEVAPFKDVVNVEALSLD